MSFPLLGITFSQIQLEHLSLPIQKSFDQALKFGFSHIRLGAYWNRIEVSQGKYDFKELRQFLTKAEKKNQAVVMTVGVKSPRWPEYYWPEFIKDKTLASVKTQKQLLAFIAQTVQELKDFNCITHWQIENEPLDPSGPKNEMIPIAFLDQEIKLIKKIDSRPVIVTLWGNDLIRRNLFHQVEELADIIGLDLYYKQFLVSPFGQAVYTGPRQRHQSLKKLLKSSRKLIWLTELQAEPWEKNDLFYRSENPQSISPELILKNIKHVRDLPIKEILLWGFEYWLWRSKQGDNRYLDLIKQLV